MTKFNFKKQPVDTKAIFRGNQILSFKVFVQGRNASVNESNSYMETTMKQIFATHKPTETSSKLYQISYKFSGGEWRSTQFFSNDAETKYLHPNMKDHQYGIDHSDDLVEFIKISMVETVQKKK